MDDRAVRLAQAVRDHPVVVDERASHHCVGGAHSYLGDGRVVCWVVPGGPGGLDGAVGVAVDAELSAQRVPPGVERRWTEAAGDPDRFWSLWCATEVVAKLGDVPMVVLAHGRPVVSSPVRTAGLEVYWAVRRVEAVVVAQGVAWATTTDDVT